MGGLFGGIAGALGGFASGGYLGAAAGLIGGMGDGRDQYQRSGRDMRAWDPNEQKWLESIYADQQANQGMTPQQREQFISDSTAGYFNPMQKSITSGLNQALGRSAVNNARRGMAGSSQAMFGDAATGRQAAGMLSDAAYKSRQLGQQDYYAFDQNRRANLSSDTSQLGSLWNARNYGSTSWQSTPTGDAATGMGLLGMGLFSGSKYTDQLNNAIGGIFKGSPKKGPDWATTAAEDAAYYYP